MVVTVSVVSSSANAPTGIMTNSIANAKSALTSRIFFVRIQTLSFFCDVLNTHVFKCTQ